MDPWRSPLSVRALGCLVGGGGGDAQAPTADVELLAVDDVTGPVSVFAVLAAAALSPGLN